MDAGEKLTFLSLIRIFFFHDFCIAKNSSLMSIPKLNVPAIKENSKEKTCGSHSYLRTPFLCLEVIWNNKTQIQALSIF